MITCSRLVASCPGPSGFLPRIQGTFSVRVLCWDNSFPNRGLPLRVLIGVQKDYRSDPPARIRATAPASRPRSPVLRPRLRTCSGKQSFLKLGNPKKKPSFSLQTYAPSRKFRSLFRSGKASFSLQTGAPSEKNGPNGRRRRAKVGNR